MLGESEGEPNITAKHNKPNNSAISDTNLDFLLSSFRKPIEMICSKLSIVELFLESKKVVHFY